MNRDYLLISPCRDEEAFLQTTIDTVAAQAVLPRKWIIVDDGSTDSTPTILEQAEREHEFIEVIRREDRGGRAVGPGVIEAFNAGLAHVDLDDYDYLCKLDVDLELAPRYFESLMERFETDPYLGTCSGKLYLRQRDGRLVEERCGDENSVGPTKFYRVACFRDIGGFVPFASWDGIDGHLCRMKGWIAESVDLPGCPIVHLRRMGSSQQSFWTGRKRWGAGKYFMGSTLPYVMAASAYRMLERPYIVSGLGILVGYLQAMGRRQRRFNDPDYLRFFRRYEHESLVRGKRRTMRRHHERIRRELPPPEERTKPISSLSVEATALEAASAADEQSRERSMAPVR